MNRSPLKLVQQPLCFVALFIQFLVVLPWMETALLWRRYRLHSHRLGLLAVLLAFIRPVHQQWNFGRLASLLLNNLRPSGASCAFPGDKANFPAVRSFAGKHKIFVVQPPLDFPMDCEPSFADFALSKQFFLNFFHFFVI